MLDQVQIFDKSFNVRVEPDDIGNPWDWTDCHGPVTKWLRRGKRPGEKILAHDRGANLFYDFAEACKIARKFWGAKTKEDAAKAAQKDFDYLRGYCDGHWYYVTVIVELLDKDGKRIDFESCGGIESDSPAEYIGSLAKDLAKQLYNSHKEPEYYI